MANLTLTHAKYYNTFKVTYTSKTSHPHNDQARATTAKASSRTRNTREYVIDMVQLTAGRCLSGHELSTSMPCEQYLNLTYTTILVQRNDYIKRFGQHVLFVRMGASRTATSPKPTPNTTEYKCQIARRTPNATNKV